MKTPITPLRMPSELKERIKKQSKKEGYTLSGWIFKELELSLDINEMFNRYLNK